VARILERFGDRLAPYEQAVLQVRRATIEGDEETMLSASRRAAELAPGSHDALNRAVIAYSQNRPREAVDAFMAFDFEHGWVRYHSIYWAQLSNALYNLGEFERALDAARRAYELEPDGGDWGPVFVLSFQVPPLAALGRLGELHQVLDEIEAVPSPESVRPQLAASVAGLRAYGHDAAAGEIGERAKAWFEARQVFETAVRDFPEALVFRVLRIIVCMQRGETAQAQRDLERLEGLDVWNSLEGRMVWFRGVVAGALGDRDGAVNLLRESGLILSRDDWLEIWHAPFRGYPPFEELLAPEG
jgi:tetratricopeptide (TPR) repeat protein